MEVYVSKKDEKRKYIENVDYNVDGTLSITFADGRTFSNIKQCDENIEKINKVQEEQAKAGLEKYVKFKNKVGAAIVLIGCCGICLGGVSAEALLGNVNPVVFGCACGVITVFGIVPSMIKLARNKRKVDELSKIRFRNDNIDKLKKYKDYDNSLVGVGFDTRAYLGLNSEMENPFNIVGIDDYTKEDLETIVSNIESDDELGLVYVKS